MVGLGTQEAVLLNLADLLGKRGACLAAIEPALPQPGDGEYRGAAVIQSAAQHGRQQGAADHDGCRNRIEQVHGIH